MVHYLEKAIPLTCKLDLLDDSGPVRAIQVFQIHHWNVVAERYLRHVGLFMGRQNIFVLHLIIVYSISQQFLDTISISLSVEIHSRGHASFFPFDVIANTIFFPYGSCTTSNCS